MDRNSFLTSAVWDGRRDSMRDIVSLILVMPSPSIFSMELVSIPACSLSNCPSFSAISVVTFMAIYESSIADEIMVSTPSLGISATVNPIPFLTGCLVIKKKVSCFIYVLL